MADGLSIGSALITIIGATGRIVLTVKQAVEAPQHIMRVLTQAQTFRLTAIILKNLLIQLMYDDSDQPSSSSYNINKDAQTILYVNDIAGVLFESMSIITELEKKLEGIDPPQEGTSSSLGSSKAANIAKWMWQEKDILELLQCLESYKSSLDLIVTCLTCQKVDQAQREARKFHMMRQQDIHTLGVQQLENSDATDNMSTSTPGHPGVTLTQPQISSLSSSSKALIMSNPAGNSPASQISQQLADANFTKNMTKTIVPNVSGGLDHKEFLKDLLSSRVYNRALRKVAASSEDMTISEFQLSGWSVFRYNPEKHARLFGSSRGRAQLMFKTPRALFSNSPEMRNKALIKAVYEGEKDIVSALISQLNANIEVVCKDLAFLGARPLHIACRTKQIEMIKLLLELGADVEATDGTGNKPLAELFSLCLDRKTVLFSIKDLQICSNIIRLLLEQGADTETTDPDGKQPLHTACQSGETELTKLLLDHGANTEATDKDGNRPLHIACQSGGTELTKLLLDHGADTEATDQDGLRPLHIVCQRGETELAKLLLDHGANIEAVDRRGNRPLHIVCQSGETELTKLLLDHGINIGIADRRSNQPHIACQIELTELLLDRGADIEAANNYGNRPLHVACCTGKLELTQLLLDHNADMEAADKDGNRPLHLVKWKLVARALLKHGADRTAWNKACELSRWHDLPVD